MQRDGTCSDFGFRISDFGPPSYPPVNGGKITPSLFTGRVGVGSTIRNLIVGMALVLIPAALLIAFFPVVGFGFVWDDNSLILGNHLTGSFSNIHRFFSVDLWESTTRTDSPSGYYRPLMLLDLTLDRALFGLDPAGIIYTTSFGTYSPRRWCGTSWSGS